MAASSHRPELAVDHDPAPGQLDASDRHLPGLHLIVSPADGQRHADRRAIVVGLRDADGDEASSTQDRAGPRADVREVGHGV
jgi:hypothetical protein